MTDRVLGSDGVVREGLLVDRDAIAQHIATLNSFLIDGNPLFLFGDAQDAWEAIAAALEPKS